MTLQKLNEMAEEIQQDFNVAETNLSIVGVLNIKIRSFQNLLKKNSNGEIDSANLKKLRAKETEFVSKLKVLTAIKMQEKNEMIREMKESNLTVQSTYEQPNASASDFYSEQSSRLDNLIGTTMDSFEGLRKQSVYIDNINNKLKVGLSRMGVSGSLISKIESRSFGDKSIFIFLLVFVVLLMFLLRFVFK